MSNTNNEVRFLVSLGADVSKLKLQADKALAEYKTHNIKLQIDTTGVVKNVSGVTEELKKVKKATDSIKPVGNLFVGSEKKVIQEVTKEYQKLGQEVYIFSKNSKDANEKFVESLKRAGNQVNVNKNAQTGAITKIVTTYKNSSNEIIKTYFNPIEARYDHLNAKVKNGARSVEGFVATTQKLNNTETFNLARNVEKYSNALDQARFKGSITTEQFNKLEGQIKRTFSASGIEKLNKELDKTVKKYEQQNALKNKQLTVDSNLIKLQSDLNRIQNSNPRLAHDREFKSTISNIQAQINEQKKLTTAIDRTALSQKQLSLLSIDSYNKAIQQTNAIRSSVTELSGKSQQALRNSLGLTEALRVAFERFPIWMLASTAFYGTIRGIKELTENVIMLDTALTNMRRVMDLPEHKFNEVLEKSIENVTELSGKLQGYLELVSEFGRMGFNDLESLDLADTAQLLSNISELKPNESVSSLVSAMISFNITAEESIKIADKLNEVDNNYAITTKDLTLSMNKAASTAATFGRLMPTWMVTSSIKTSHIGGTR